MIRDMLLELPSALIVAAAMSVLFFLLVGICG